MRFEMAYFNPVRIEILTKERQQEFLLEAEVRHVEIGSII